MKKAILIITLIMAQGCASLDKKPATQMRYNYMENQWEYACPESQLRYNYYEQKWEWSK